jgi:hypothetical protein
MRRILAVAIIASAISVPATVATLGMASGQAFASSSVSCTGLKGSATGTITISKCSPSGGKGYKSASGTGAELATGGNITWKSSGATTTIGDASFNDEGQGSCKKNDTEYSYTGQVTGASTTGTGIPAVGDTVSGDVCLTSSGKVSLVKGTSLNL